MRARELMERAAQSYYMHCTSLDNLQSIMKLGLIPNKSNDGEGNYTDSVDWLSLDGIYATKEPELIEGYARAHGLESFLICVLVVSPNSVLPDEDTINILMDKCFRATPHEAKEVDGEWSDEPDDEFYQHCALLFHEQAKTPGDTRPPHMDDLIHLVQEYYTMQNYGGVEDPFEWKDLKDRLCRRYPRMSHPDLGQGWSIRIPDAVSFSGRNRIVALVEVIDDYGKLIWGRLPDEAKGMVSRLFFNPL